MKKKISMVLLASVIGSNITPALNVFADEVLKEQAEVIVENAVNNAKISKFDLKEYDSFEKYNSQYKVQKEDILSISNNGGKYGSSSIDKAIDGDMSTHWETGKANSSTFTNEVVVEFDNIEKIDRMAYATRQDGAKGKGYPTKFEVYTSITGNDEDFKLVSQGTSSSTGNMMEFKFDTITAKKIKFVFVEANQSWASASEFWFYREDKIIDKFSKIFTDDTMSKVSEEFNTVEKMNAFIEEAKNHPLYEGFKEDIENAKSIVESEEVNYTTSKISKFDISGNELKSYNKQYNVPINKISTNGGHYGSNSIDKAIDGDLSTSWHSEKQNSKSFTNEVILDLEKINTLNRIIYNGPVGTSRGFAEAFDIYASKTTKGDTFKLVSSGTTTASQDSIEIKFNPTEFKRVKFVFKKGYEDWACAGEFRLYKQDKLSEKIPTIFKDYTMTEVSEEFNTIDKLEALEEECKDHPLYNRFKEDLELAKDILSNPDKYIGQVYELEQRGDSQKESKKRKLTNFKDWQVTGLTAKPGDVLNVYVEVKEGEPTPQLVYKQSINRHGSSKTFNLHNGKNTIVIPEYDNVKDDVAAGVIFGGAVYMTNYNSDNQTSAPKVRITGGEKYPVYVHGKTTDEQIMKELETYVEKVKNDPKNTVDLFDLSGDQTICTVKATTALQWYRKNNKAPSYTVGKWEDIMDKVYKFWGFDNSSELNTRHNSRIVFMTKNITGSTFMNASGGYVGIRPENQDAILSASTGWGTIHEIGHLMDTGGRTMVELTNNILPIYIGADYTGVSRITTDNKWESKIYPKVTTENYSDNVWQEESGDDSLVQLAPLWQLNLYSEGFYGKFEQAYRANNFNLGDRLSISESWIKVSSDILKLDLTEFFARHGIHASEKTIEAVSKYPKPDKKLYYLNDNAFNYEGAGFQGDTITSANINIQGNNAKLNFEINKSESNNLLGYEILKDGKVIGFTSTNTFTDKDIDLDTNSKYEIIPYDVKLQTGESIELNSFTPSIKVQQEKISLGLKEKFNPLSYVKGLSHNSEDITSKIEVEHNVDTTKKGLYTVKYTVIDEDIKVEKIVEVEVVSSYNYLSDSEWKSVETQYGTPRRNSNIKGRVNGEVTTFEKGFGIHANGKIVYDLGEHNYENFEALLGVDMNLASQNNSSITFKIVGDGKTLATTKVLKHADNMVDINVPVKGVKELVIEIHDGGNGRTSDHGVIANPKLTTNNSKPNLTVSNKVYKIGEEVDLMEGISANDTEDGDLTSSIKITSNSYEENKAGKFEVVYNVTDSDGNTVEKKAYITVYEDFKVIKSKYGQFDNLDSYNEEFKLQVASVSNNGGNYGNSVISNAINNNIDSHWETGKPNSSSFKNEVIFDLGEVTEVDKIAFGARRGGKGFASKFEIYVSNEAKGNDFVLAGKGEYNGSINDVVEFKISNNTARRVKFKFVEANQGWASIGEMSFYKKDILSDKINNELFTDETKTSVNEKYNTLEKLKSLREEVSSHAAAKLFEADLNKAEEIIKSKFPSINVPKTIVTKLGLEIDLKTDYTATDKEDGDITNKVEVKGTEKVNFNKAGTYEVIYSVTDSDKNTTEAIRKVKVVDMDDNLYISDIDWKSGNTGWGSIKKDKAISGNAVRLTGEDNKEVVYEKGIGTHSTSTITYDLTKDDYGYFTSFVGVDRTMFGSVGAVTFEVYLDNKKVYDSGLMASRDAQKLVDINLNGAKELKLVVTDGKNGNGSDHANWADAKLHLVKEGKEVNREKLDDLITTVNELKESNYSEDSYASLKEILDSVEKSLKDGYNQSEIDTLYDDLKEVFDNLEKIANFEELEKVINENSKYNELHYFAEPMKAHKALIEEGKAMINSNTASQEEIDSMCEKILESAKKLVVRQNKVELGKVIEKASAIENNNYNPDRWESLKDGLIDAKAVYNDTNATDSDVESFTYLINYLISELE